MISLFILILLSSLSVQAEELKSSHFYLCIKKTATEVQSRNIRIHQFKKDNKCAVVYSVKGKDQLISSGKWMTFCKRTLNQVLDNLEKGLWDCKEKPEVQVFHSL